MLLGGLCLLLGGLCLLLGGFAAVVMPKGTTVCQEMLLGGLLWGIDQGLLQLLFYIPTH